MPANKLGASRVGLVFMGMLCAIESPIALAQAQTASQLQSQRGSLTTDLSMPSTPAALHVGLAAESVVQPKNRRDFEVAAKSLLKDGGKPAGSMELLPYFIVRSGELDYAAYEKSGWLRALTRTSLGVATGTRKVGDAKAELTANGLSISTVVADLADPAHHLRLQNCLNDAQRLAIEEAGAGGPGAEAPLPTAGQSTTLTNDDKLNTPKALAKYNDCMKDFKARSWNRSRVGFGLATGNGRELAGAKRRVKYGSSAWVSVQYGFEDFDVLRKAFLGQVFVDCTNERTARGTCAARPSNSLEQRAMVTLHARRTTGATDLDLAQAGALPTLRSSLLGARFTYGTDDLNFFVEASRQVSHQSLVGTTRTNLYAFGGSRQIGENFWLNFLSGRRKELASGKPENIVQFDFSWGLSEQPIFGRTSK